MPACSVVVAFYNKLRELELVLAGFARQSFRDFEIIIADDGSRPEVVTDLEAIGGFDERYQAAGVGEDTDVGYRLRLAGRRLRSLNNIAVQYHLYHRLLPRDPRNDALFAETRARGEAWTPYGLHRDEA